MSRFSMDSTLGELLKDKEAKSILEKYFGDLVNHPLVGIYKNKTIKDIIEFAKGKVNDELIENIKDEIMQLL
ncbi:MAG: hypothetical protein GX285_04850 [Clostridiales bacterium]|nr:hypothetical protein [Clostridiales bacterium]